MRRVWWKIVTLFQYVLCWFIGPMNRVWNNKVDLKRGTLVMLDFGEDKNKVYASPTDPTNLRDFCPVGVVRWGGPGGIGTSVVCQFGECHGVKMPDSASVGGRLFAGEGGGIISVEELGERAAKGYTGWVTEVGIKTGKRSMYVKIESGMLM